MKKNILKCLLFVMFVYHINITYAGGFTANWVDIVRLNNGHYRVIIKYTNLNIVEYREAYVDFTSKKEAIDVFQKLAKGATFFWGDSKKIYFPTEPEKPKPY